MNNSYPCLVSHKSVGGNAIIFCMCVCVRQRDRGRRESTVAAVEEIIPSLDLSLSNRNSYNYCGSIRLKRQKKIFSEREGMHIIHRSAAARWNTETELSQRHNAAVVSSFFFVWFKNCQPCKYFISAFPHWPPFFQF